VRLEWSRSLGGDWAKAFPRGVVFILFLLLITYTYCFGFLNLFHLYTGLRGGAGPV